MGVHQCDCGLSVENFETEKAPYRFACRTIPRRAIYCSISLSIPLIFAFDHIGVFAAVLEKLFDARKKLKQRHSKCGHRIS